MTLRRVLLAAAAAAVVALTLVAASGARVESGSAILLDADFGTGQPTAAARPEARIVQVPDGYAVEANSEGAVTVPLAPPAQPGRVVLRLWAYGTGLVTTTVAIEAGGRERLLGRPGTWAPRELDITRDLAGGTAQLVVRAQNGGPEARLVLDKLQVIRIDPGATPDAASWLIALWAAALVAFVLLALNGLRRHAALPLLVAGAAVVLWERTLDLAAVPVTAGAGSWRSARDASWLGIDDGALWGAFDGQSHLWVQVQHVLVAFAGEGDAGARTTGVLAMLAAICAVYWLGNRVAGPVGATVAAAALPAFDSVRGAAVEGLATPLLVILAALVLGLVLAARARPDRRSFALLGAACGAAVLAEPLWLPGVIVLLAGLTFTERAPEVPRRALAAAALAALSVVALPNRISLAHQHGGDLAADYELRATAARDAEMGGGGDPIGLFAYWWGEHDPAVAAGGVLTGGYDALAVLADRPESGVVGLLAVVLALLGGLYLLLVPHLRGLPLVALLLGAPGLFLVDRAGGLVQDAGAPLTAVLLAGSAALAYASRSLLSERVSTNWLQPRPPRQVMRRSRTKPRPR